MANLFKPSDFTLFTQYHNKTKDEAPGGQKPLRNLYDRLNEIIDGLRKHGYTCHINRNPLMQGGPGVMKYAEYHWSRVYPKNPALRNDCMDKIFIVVGTTEDGVNIHIDSYTSKGYYQNKAAEDIKNDTWLQIEPDEASKYSCDDYVIMVDKYFHDYWKEFNQFGKEFGIVECIKILNNMTIDNLKGLLLGNYNLILTGAPGTGKTYLAKKIAESMGCDKDHIGFVQFHPSYDYTDFVEGLRPKKEGNSLGFQRKDGVFKEFCRRALKKAPNSIEEAYKYLWDKVRKKEIKQLVQYGPNQVTQEMEVKEDNPDAIYFLRKDGNFESDTSVTLNKVKIAYDNGIKTLEDLKSLGSPDREMFGTQSNPSNTWAVMNYLLTLLEKSKSKQPFVFIIDEINRGEISKIFGELFYAIDPGYRGEKGKVETQYQNLIPKEEDADFNATNPDVFRHGFFVPDNVYIIGTMNDIDRSVESMDFAMRRRFAWQEITAESRQSMLDEDDAWTPNTKPGQPVIEEIKNRMNNLNACIVDKYKPEKLSSKDKIGLTSAYHIGASYFLKYALYNDFDKLWGNHIEGLLREYLRGTTNLDDKINKLREAYNDTEHIDYK